MTEREARCPGCREWSPVVWEDDIPPGGLWWRDSADCPICGAVVLVESECDMREVVE